MNLGAVEPPVDGRPLRVVRPEKSGRATAYGPNCRNEMGILLAPERIGSAFKVPRYFRH